MTNEDLHMAILKFIGWWIVCAVAMIAVAFFALGITVIVHEFNGLPEHVRDLVFFGAASFLLAALAQALWGTRR